MTFPQRLRTMFCGLRISRPISLCIMLGLAILVSPHAAKAQVGSCGAYCNGYYGQPNKSTWHVIRTPVYTTDAKGNSSQSGLVVTIISEPGGVSISYTYSSVPNECSATVSVSFERTNPNGSGNYLGTCIISGPKALVEASRPLGTCNPNNPSSWTSNCTMPPVCPASSNTAGRYYCGYSDINSTAQHVCACNPDAAVGGLGSACISDSNGGGHFNCGNSQTCNCTQQYTAAATAPYCIASNPTNSATCIPEPNYNNLESPQEFTSSNLTAVEQGMDNLARPGNTSTVAPSSLISAIMALSNETQGCTIAR